MRVLLAILLVLAMVGCGGGAAEAELDKQAKAAALLRAQKNEREAKRLVPYAERLFEKAAAEIVASEKDAAISTSSRQLQEEW